MTTAAHDIAKRKEARYSASCCGAVRALVERIGIAAAGSELRPRATQIYQRWEPCEELTGDITCYARHGAGLNPRWFLSVHVQCHRVGDQHAHQR